MSNNQKPEEVPLPRPEGRFNHWGERKLVIASDEKIQAIAKELEEFQASPRVKSLLWAAKLTGSTGVEFVFISDAQFSPIVFEKNGIQIVPCFTPLNPNNPQTEKRQAAMMKWGQFIYDGWVPGVELTPHGLDRVVSDLDEMVSLFSIVGRFFAYWEPKYFFATEPVPSQITLPEDFDALGYSTFIMSKLPQTDRSALNRSLAWFSNALRDEYVQRFLLLFLSIESLATYIESSSTPAESVLRRAFAAAKLEKSERNKYRDECIKEVLDGGGSLVEKIQTAYLRCIYKSIKDTLTDHLDRVFQSNDATRTIFTEEVNDKTLWDLRNDIAHGSLNLLRDVDIQFICSRSATLEVIARSYLRKIFSALAQRDYFPRPRKPILTIPFAHAVGLPGAEFKPTDMAEYYANVESLSESFARIRFD